MFVNRKPAHKRSKGFSLVELLIVVAIIMIVAAIAIPNFMVSQRAALEVSAIALLRSLNTEETRHHASNEVFSKNFTELGLAKFGTSQLADCEGAGAGTKECAVLVKGGYIYTLNARDGDWQCKAEPIRDRASGRYFFADDSGIIRFEHGTGATKGSPPVA